MADVAGAADAKPDAADSDVKKDQAVLKTENDVSGSDTERKSDADANGPLGVFGGWGLPDINSVTEGIGGMLGEMVEGSEDEEVAERAAGSGAGDGAPDGPGEDLQKAAAEAAAVATKELEKSAKAAQETLGKAAEEIGKGWGSLNMFIDDILAPGAGKDNAPAVADDDLADGEDVQERFRSLFPEIDDGEEVVDHYACTLLQKYRCFLNNATPEKTIPVRGRLYVTTSHLAMTVFDDGGAFDGAKFNVTLPFEDVARVQKGAKSMMRVLTNSQTSYIFANFESETHFGGALSLVEMFLESSSKPGAGSTAEEAEPPESAEPAGNGDSGTNSKNDAPAKGSMPPAKGKKGKKSTK